MLHTLKIERPYADAVLYGYKNFEVRYNDRGYQKGDFIQFNVLTEDASQTVDKSHSLTGNIYEITYVHSGLGMKEGYVTLGIKPSVGYDNIVFVPIK